MIFSCYFHNFCVFVGINLKETFENNLLKSLYDGNISQSLHQHKRGQDEKDGAVDTGNDSRFSNVFKISTKNFLKVLIPEYVKNTNTTNLFKVRVYMKF